MDEYPVLVTALVIGAKDAIANVTRQLENNEISVDEWKEEVSRIITQHALAAMMLGLEAEVLTEQAQKAVAELVTNQVQYLNRFGSEIASSAEWQDAWNTRAEMYGESIGSSYWHGLLFKGGDWEWHYEPEADHCDDCLELNGQRHPAEWWIANHLPRDGRTECLTHCMCTLYPV